MSKSKSAFVVFAVVGVLATARLVLGESPTTQPAAATFSYAGRVLDERGKPISGVQVVATHRSFDDRSFGYIDEVESDAQGRFEIDQKEALSGASPASVVEEVVRLEFHHPDYAYGRLEDLHLFNREQATHLTATLREGRKVEGRALDAERRPVPGTSIEIVFDDVVDLRRGTVSDGNGRFTFRGLPAREGVIHALTVEPNQPTLTAQMKVSSSATDVADIVLSPIDLPTGAAVHELFGMKLVDVDEATQRAFHLPRTGGVLVLDPGPQVERLKIGRLQRGDQFWIVGQTPVKDFSDFRSRLFIATRFSPDKAIRVVYCLKRPGFSGTNTQYLELNPADIMGLWP